MLVKASPHIRDNSSTQKIMLDVIIALCPAIVASGIIFGWRALLVIGVTAAASVAFEYLYCYLMKKPITIGDLSAVVTGILLAFNLPSTIPLWIAILGALWPLSSQSSCSAAWATTLQTRPSSAASCWPSALRAA